jgi:hypothetical protein
MVTKVVSPAQIGAETAAVGSLVHTNDRLTTGHKGRLQITFRDKSELTLGENATVTVDRYVFDPDAGNGEILLTTGVAAFRLATGKIGELSNKKITVSTPAAWLGVRGTDFWWGPIDGLFGVLLMSNSKVEVRNDAGGVVLNKSGYGTDIDTMKGGDGAPSRPTKWDPSKVARALSQTNIGLTINPGIISPVVPLIPFIPGVRPDEPSPPPPPRSP